MSANHSGATRGRYWHSLSLSLSSIDYSTLRRCGDALCIILGDMFGASLLSSFHFVLGAIYLLDPTIIGICSNVSSLQIRSASRFLRTNILHAVFAEGQTHQSIPRKPVISNSVSILSKTLAISMTAVRKKI